MLNANEDVNPKASLLYFGHIDNEEVKRYFPAFFIFKRMSHLFNLHALVLNEKCEDCGGLLINLQDNTTWLPKFVFCSYCGKKHKDHK